MTKQLASPPASRSPTKWNFFGPPPLLDGEDPAAYDELLARVSGAVKPSDILEEIWVRDVVDLVWEALRLRRLKAELLAVNAYKGLEEVLEPLSDFIQAQALARTWACNNPDGIEEVEKLLTSAGLSMDAVMAQTLALNLDQVEKIDRMIMSAEARRNAVLREVHRHRASVAQALRQVANLEDAQFTEIAPKQSMEQKAA
jgi:hypothetical protein